MNNLFKLLTISFLTCIMVSGCSTLSRTFTTVEPNYSPQVNAELDVDLSHKIIARNKTTYLFGFLKVSGGHKYAETDGVHGSWFGRKGTRSRAAVVYEALNGSDYDAIAVPNFNTVKKVGFLHLWETYVTTLTGYGAKVKTVHVEGGDTVVVGTMDEDVAKAKEVARTHSSNINTETLYLFESGSVKKADKNTASSFVDSFCEEIEGDIKSAKTLDDVVIIRRKIDALQAYNRSLNRPEPKVSKCISDLNEGIDSKAVKISRSASRTSAGNRPETAGAAPAAKITTQPSEPSSATSEEAARLAAENAGAETVVEPQSAGEIKLTSGTSSNEFSVAQRHEANDCREYVDLGLSVKWATCNVGASKPEDYGAYYQWADIKDVTDKGVNLDWSNCPYHTGSSSSTGWTKYVPSGKSSYWSGAGSPDNKIVLDQSDDVAYAEWGDGWRMPTDADWKELRSNCSWTWASIDGIYGYKVQSKKPGYTSNWIFLPAAGYRNGDRSRYVGSYGNYWSSSLYTGSPYDACSVSFYSGAINKGHSNRCFGLSIRPVIE